MAATTRRKGATGSTPEIKTSDPQGNETTNPPQPRTDDEENNSKPDSKENNDDNDEDNDNDEDESKNAVETLTETRVAPQSDKVVLHKNLRPYFIGEKCTCK